MPVKVTTQVLLGRKSHGCPAAYAVAGGETWVANKPGGLNVRYGDDLETPSAMQSLSGSTREADLLEGRREGRRRRGRNRHTHLTTRRDHGPGILGQTCRDNVGKGHRPAGAGSNLQRPPGISGGHEILVEGGGLAHEPVRAMTKG